MLFDNPPQIRWSDKASTGSRAQRSRLLRLTSSRDADLSLMYLKWSKQTALSRWRQWIACTRSTHSEGWHGLWSRVVLVVLSRGWRWSSVEAVQRCIVHGARGVGRPRPARGPVSGLPSFVPRTPSEAPVHIAPSPFARELCYVSRETACVVTVQRINLVV